MDSGTTAQLPAGRLNKMNGPETEMQHCKQQQSDTVTDDNIVNRKGVENHMIKNPLYDDDEPSILSTANECRDCVEVTQISDLTCPCKNNEGHNNSNFGVGISNVNAHAMDVAETDSSKMSKLKTKVSAGAVLDQGLTNGCCTCDRKDTLTTVLNVDEQGNHIRNVNHNSPESKTQGTSMPKPLKDLAKSSCNSHINMMNEPLLDLTKMVENVCLGSGEASRDLPFSSTVDKLKHAASKETVPCDAQAANSSDLLAGMDHSFGVIGPAGADLGDPDLEELPASLSDFVLGCHENQYAVPPCPPNDSDINTIHIEKEEHPIVLVPYKSEVQMPDIMRLITKDLSEPYSIYTYRYFIHNWPQLCFLAMHQDKCVGAIVCKLDVHKKMVRRGYIAMLAVDENYRKLQIGSSLVKKAIRAMVRGECDEVVLETEITNKPALRLYENLGFVRDKRLFRYYLNGVDALRLKLWLR